MSLRARSVQYAKEHVEAEEVYLLLSLSGRRGWKTSRLAVVEDDVLKEGLMA